jgi:hypothetical protein
MMLRTFRTTVTNFRAGFELYKGAFSMRYIFTRSESPRPAFRLAVAFLLVAAASALLLQGHLRTMHASSPAIQITPNSGPYGTVTVVTGQGFAAHEQVAIYKETRPFFAYETDANGNFVGTPHALTGPGPANGIITISGTGRTSGLKATTIFTVTP